MLQKYILVVGGAGFIGSQVNKMLTQAGYLTIVLDNLSRGSREAVTKGIFIEGDIADSTVLNQIFTQYFIAAVMHFAASIDVAESMKEPLYYYQNNVVKTLNLLQAMHRHEVNHFIFSSSAAIFGIPQEPSITESHPCHPINPYGQSKLMVETILQDVDRAYSIRSCCLRYFNAAGGDPEGVIKYQQRKESNLIPLVLENLQKPEGIVSIFGTDYPTPDGTCIRDYVHVADLATAHITAMEKLLHGAPSSCYNLGNGQGFSVRQVIDAAARVTGKTPRIVLGPRRAGDPPVLVANASKALHELQWKPRYPSLEVMIEHAWKARLFFA